MVVYQFGLHAKVKQEKQLREQSKMIRERLTMPELIEQFVE